MKVSYNDFLLVNLHNVNKESKQLNTLSILCNLLDKITYLHCENIILGGDFNIFFIYHVTYEARRGNPKMKNKFVAKFIYIKESLGKIQRRHVIHSDNSMSLVSFREG